MARLRVRISLANKCQILFAAAVLLILAAALAVPWLRMQDLVERAQLQIASRLADAWVEDLAMFEGRLQPRVSQPDEPAPADLRLWLIDHVNFEIEASADPFVFEALEHFEAADHQRELFTTVTNPDGASVYRYARAIRTSDLETARAPLTPIVSSLQVADPLRSILLIEMRADWAEEQVAINRIYLAASGLLAGVLAIGVFWFITTRLFLSPLRVLKETAEKVSLGDLNIRSDINTGDEFEHLSETFNSMLGSLKGSQDKLRELNKQLDLKLGELAQSNVSLYEANRIKGDFLANVSHELKTPLNSIIGFAEILNDSIAKTDAESVAKLRRYIDNIASSSRALLQLINDLLDLAKIEAGRMELHPESVPLADTLESLAALMRPQTDRKGVELRLKAPRGLPVITTDPGRFQQIIFNFLSNAAKFTPKGGSIVLGAESLADPEDGEGGRVRVYVTDTGPGIPVDEHETIFDKFRQLDSSHTREHGGTGLGLAISQELARLLQGSIELDSDVGRGATFSLILPLTLTERAAQPLMPDVAG